MGLETVPGITARKSGQLQALEFLHPFLEIGFRLFSFREIVPQNIVRFPIGRQHFEVSGKRSGFDLPHDDLTRVLAFRRLYFACKNLFDLFRHRS